LDIDGIDKARRRTAFVAAHGEIAAELKDEALHKETPLVEHGRDLYRIVRALMDTEL